MKRIAFAAAILAVAACSKAGTPADDTTTPALAPAPAALDSAMMADSVRKADSVRRADSVRKADSVKAAGTKTKGRGTKAKTP